MRTSTAAWAAALAVMSMSGPFTTAEAAPARAADHEHPRLVHAKLRRRQGFNDTDSSGGNGLGVPLLGGSSTSSPSPADATSKADPTSKSDPVPLVNSILGQSDTTTSTTTPRIPPLTTSVSEPDDRSPPPSQSTDSGGGLAGSLLSTLLQPTSDLTVPLTQPTDTPTTRTDDRESSTTTQSDNDPLLGSITGQLSNVLPTPSGVGLSSGTVVVGITTVLHQTTTPLVPSLSVPSLPGTGNSGPESTKTGLLPLPNPSGLPTGNILPTPSIPAINSISVPGLQSGGPPLGTGLSGLTGTVIPSVVSSVESAASVPTPTGLPGTGSIISQLTGTGGLPITKVTETGGIPGVVSSVKPVVSSVLSPGLSGPVTGLTPTSILGTSPIVTLPQSDATANPTTTLDSVTPNPSQPTGSVVPSVPSGTGNTSPPSGSTFTATVDGTSVVVTVPDNSAKTGVTAPPDSASTASAPVVTASNDTESTKSSEASESPLASQTTTTNVASQTATTNDTTPVRTTNTPSTSVLATPAASTTPLSGTATSASVQPQVSIVATGTDTQTTLSLPTTWSFAPSSSNTEASGTEVIASATTATDTSSGFPTTMPRLVQPATGMPNPGANFTLVQVGFSFGLNYPFVVGKPESAMQIFAYLPRGIAHGLGIPKENVLMNALMPYDTSQQLGYITTLAQTYIPADLVNELQLHLHAPTSPIYLSPDAPVRALMDMVNPTIPILPGAAMDGYSSSSAYNAAATTRAGEGDGAPIGGDSGSAKKVSGASVGIGLGAIGGAAVYAAAMIYVARRYRQKRKGHQRASSVPTAGEMTQTSSGGMGGLFMAGANGRNSPRTLVSHSGGRNSRTSNNSSNGRSIREQGISAPLMSENSLGWN